MRHGAVVAVAVLLAAACSDSGVAPTSPGGIPTTIRASLTGTDPGTDDLCNGLSPCDAYDGYWHGENEPGINFTSPGVNNHKPFGGDFVPGLAGQLQVYSCPITGYNDATGAFVADDYPAKGSGTPVVDCSSDSPANSTYPTGKFRWPDPVEDLVGEFYRTDLQWKLSGKDKKNPPAEVLFRVYVAAGERVLGFRDVIIDSNLTKPADDDLAAIATGTVPLKFYVGSEVGCTTFNSNDNSTEDSAICLIAGSPSLDLTGVDPSGNTITASVTFDNQAATEAFIAEFELTECESLGPREEAVSGPDNTPVFGGASMDLLFLGCALRIDAPTDAELTNAATVVLKVLEPLYCNTPGQCVIVLQDEAGQSMLPVSYAVASASPLRELIGSGLNKLAALFGAKPLVATAVGGTLSGGFRRLSDIQAAVGAVLDYNTPGLNACDPVSDSCRDLGVVTGPTPVTVKVTDPFGAGIPGVRVHFFPDEDAGGTNRGVAACVAGFDCYGPTTPDPTTGPTGSQTTWSPQTVVITDDSGDATVSWSLGAGGERAMKILVCGGAIPGSDTPQDDAEPSWQDGDFVWGVLQTCDRDSADDPEGEPYPASDPAPGAVDANGWANGHIVNVVDAFNPNPPAAPDVVGYEIAANDLSLTVLASGCPMIDVTDGLRLDEWPADCIGEYVFTANTTGKTTPDNGSVLWTNDGTFLYVAIEIRGAGAKDLNDAFFYFDNDATAGSGNVGEAYSHAIHAGDDVVVMRLDEAPVTTDHFAPVGCEGSPKASLCASVDATTGNQAFGAAGVDGSNLFWEFRKELAGGSCPNGSGEDFCLGLVLPDYVGITGTITGGQGGGKGGTEFPANDGYILIEIK